MGVRVGVSRKLSTRELMLLNCGVKIHDLSWMIKGPNSFLLQASKLKKKVKSLKGLKLGYVKSTD